MFVAVSDSWPQKSLYGETAKQHTMTVLPEPSSQLSPRTHRSLCLSFSLLSVMQPSLLPHSCPTNIPLIASCASQNMLCTFCLTPAPFFVSSDLIHLPANTNVALLYASRMEESYKMSMIWSNKVLCPAAVLVEIETSVSLW